MTHDITLHNENGSNFVFDVVYGIFSVIINFCFSYGLCEVRVVQVLKRDRAQFSGNFISKEIYQNRAQGGPLTTCLFKPMVYFVFTSCYYSAAL